MKNSILQRVIDRMIVLTSLTFRSSIRFPNHTYPRDNGTAPFPQAGQLRDFQFLKKRNRRKRAHAPFFVALIFRYKTNIFQNKKKLHIDLKKKK